MKPFSTPQEVLLFTTTTLAGRQLYSLDHKSGNATFKFTPEQLVKICRSSFLGESISGNDRRAAAKHYPLVRLQQRYCFLRLEFCLPEMLDYGHSLDPYHFLPVRSYN